jgi:hypothetical protein
VELGVVRWCTQTRSLRVADRGKRLRASSDTPTDSVDQGRNHLLNPNSELLQSSANLCIDKLADEYLKVGNGQNSVQSNSRCHIWPADPQAAGTGSSMKLPSADLSDPENRECDIRVSSKGTNDSTRLVVNAVSEIIAMRVLSWKELAGKQAE